MMKFKRLIFDKLNPIFIENGLKIKVLTQTIINYESDDISITLSHNVRENSFTLWIGRKDSNLVEIDNEVLRDFFNVNFEINNLKLIDFANNVYLLFNSYGEKLFGNSKDFLTQLEKFNEQRSAKFTSELVERQVLNSAKKAWKEKRYAEFINILDMANQSKIPESFKKKYQIARNCLNA